MQHYPIIHRWTLQSQYGDFIPRACLFIPQRGHPLPEKYMNILDRLEVRDYCFSPYDYHRLTRSLKEICWYSSRIRCGSRTKCSHLLERFLSNLDIYRPSLNIQTYFLLLPLVCKRLIKYIRILDYI